MWLCTATRTHEPFDGTTWVRMLHVLTRTCAYAKNCMRLKGVVVIFPAVDCYFFGSWKSTRSLQWLPSHCMGGPLHVESLGHPSVWKDAGQLRCIAWLQCIRRQPCAFGFGITAATSTAAALQQQHACLCCLRAVSTCLTLQGTLCIVSW